MLISIQGPWPLRMATALSLYSVLAITSLCGATPLPLGGGTSSSAGPQTDLKVRLEKGLKVRRPSEFAFIALVVEKVRTGELPLQLVDGTFLWAKSRRPYPFQYFERGLRLRAARLGIRL